MTGVRPGCAALVLALAAACPPDAPVPGDEVMGTFGLHAVPVARACALDEVSGAPFDFDATLSRSSATGDAWLTLQGTSRPGVWDGQDFISSGSARRLFPSSCAECITFMDETLAVAVLSRTQSERLGTQCPDAPFDGGVPAPDPGTGVVGPSMTRLGFDAVRACGELSTEVRAAGATDGGSCAAECDGCQVRYRLTGARK